MAAAVGDAGAVAVGAGGRGAAEAGAAAEGAAPEGPAVLTFNSSELRMINVEMQPMPPVGGVALDVVRRTSGRATKPTERAAAAAHQNMPGIAKRVQTQCADPPEQLWEIPAGNERVVLDCCC